MANSVVSILLATMTLFSNLASADPALRIDNTGCYLYDGSGNIVFVMAEHAVLTDSGIVELIGDNSTGRWHFLTINIS